jgi:phosphotransferase system HPr (HPr) family protein
MAVILRAKAVIQNKRGLHARASAKIVVTAARCKSDHHVEKDAK